MSIKIPKLILSLVLSCAMVLPVANTLVNTNLDNTAYAEETSETINNMSFDEYESQVNTMIALVNTYRVSNGLEPYKVSPKLMEIAKQRASEEESTGVSHQRPDGTKWSTIFDEYGVSCYNIEENVGGGSLVLAGVPSTMLDYWKQSEGHNANILSSCEYIGVGVDYYDGLCYWSQIFCNSDDSQISDGAYILVSATDDEDTTTTTTTAITTTVETTTSEPVTTTTTTTTTSEPVVTTTKVATTSIPTENYDINGDGKVNFIDLILLKKKILEMI
jgi:uncharacterized protein YkwD